MLTSIAFGVLAVVAGLVTSFHYDTAGGATIAGYSVLQFFVVFAAKEIAESMRRPTAAVAG